MGAARFQLSAFSLQLFNTPDHWSSGTSSQTAKKSRIKNLSAPDEVASFAKLIDALSRPFANDY
jgi:hypothetical protein